LALLALSVFHSYSADGLKYLTIKKELQIVWDVEAVEQVNLMVARVTEAAPPAAATE
jgi:hypothetical protein